MKNNMETNKSVLEKIQKLLRKARDTRGNAHECELAMKMAQNLMLKHKISMAAVDASESNEMKFNVVEREIPMTKTGIEWNFIGWILEEFFEADIIRSERTSGTYARIFAVESSIDLAVYVFEFLNEQMKYAFKAYSRTVYRAHKQSFYYGFVEGVSFALREGKKEVVSSETPEAVKSYELVLVRTKEAIRAYINDKVPSLRKRRNRSIDLDANAYTSGVERGKKCKIHKPIEA